MRSNDSVSNEVGESDTSTRGKCKTSWSKLLRKTRSVTSKDGNQPLEMVSRLPILTFRSSACEATASMSLRQSNMRGAIHTCSVSAAIATSAQTNSTDHQSKRTDQA